MATYRAVLLKGRGGLDQLEEVELPLVAPKRGELRVRVRAGGSGATDILMRRGYYPFRPPFPFVAGYEVVGDVDAIGSGVKGFEVGQRVCALTVHGGHAEYIYRGAEHFVPVPPGLDDAEVVALILNYVTAYQMIHRVASMTRGQTALVTGANGGVGTALLSLLQLMGVRAIGAANKKYFDYVSALGAEPIESRVQPLDRGVRAVRAEGVDVAFDMIGGKVTQECTRACRRGGLVINYGFMDSMATPLQSWGRFLQGFVAVYLGTLARGRRGSFYGITMLYRRNPRLFHEDMRVLLDLLREGKLRPPIAARLSLLDAVKAQTMLEGGGVSGKIVLVASEP